MQQTAENKIIVIPKRYILPVILLTVFIIVTVRFVTLLPSQLFSVPYSTVIEDHEGELLAAIIADDGQWRFPADLPVPYKFGACIIEFEDAGFYFHRGVSISALAKAVRRNIKQGRIMSGGSTITMQVIRLSRNGQARTIPEKIIEIFMALRLELSYSKSEILAMYSAHAPFGGNVVGLEAASWRYFGSNPEDLSWGQAATLAVLPNAPSLIYPGKNDTLLLNKRNRLLKKMHSKGYFSNEVYETALAEPLPAKPYPLPDDGIHILNRVIQDNKKGTRVRTTIHKDLQNYVQEIVNKHVKILSGNRVYNASAIVIEVETGNILCYVGNTTDADFPDFQVDVINSRRSPGSTLKPLLYCAMLHEGKILPNTLIPDIPMILDGFNPQNFKRTYEGVVSASQALSRSLNVPSVHMLKLFGIEKFNHFLKKAGMTTLTKPPSYYGLSLILGGAEVKLDELSGIYASLARILIRFNQSGAYSPADIYPPSYIIHPTGNKQHAASNLTDAASIWFMLKAMIEVNRPDEDQFWFHFSSKSPIAWKTGTSYGERDAWAVGVTPKYVVGVWAGNASGEGRPGLTGVQSAAPLMFEIFDFLPKANWFSEPVDEMIQLYICNQSGYKAGPYCTDFTTQRVPRQGVKTMICPYHKQIHLDSSMQYQVHADCEEVRKMITQTRFVLPPVIEYYYKIRNPFYTSLPPFRQDCNGTEGESNFGIIYPVEGARIFMIDDITGLPGQVVFRAAHRKPDAILYWHLDGEFAGSTSGKHNIAVRPLSGKHQLTVVDNHGEMKTCNFEILNTTKKSE